MKKQPESLLPSSSSSTGEVTDGESEIGEEEVDDDVDGGEELSCAEANHSPALFNDSESELVLWNPQPIQRPVVDATFVHLPWHQRAVEVVVYLLAQTEYWLSPNGWLRAWLRLNLWIAVVLGISAATVVPAVRSVMSGVTGWTGEVSHISDDIARIVHRLPPIVVTIGAIFLMVYLVRRFRHRSRLRSGPQRHVQGRYDSYDEYQ